MATFLEAMEWLKQGKKVRRPFFHKDVWYYSFPEKVMGHVTSGYTEGLSFTCDDLRATDWEIMSEPVRYFDGAEAIRLLKKGKAVRCGDIVITADEYGGGAEVSRLVEEVKAKSVISAILCNQWRLAEPEEEQKDDKTACPACELKQTSLLMREEPNFFGKHTKAVCDYCGKMIGFVKH